MSSFDEVTGLAPEHPAAVALRKGGHAQLSFGFSAGGLIIDCALLFPWTSSLSNWICKTSAPANTSTKTLIHIISLVMHVRPE